MLISAGFLLTITGYSCKKDSGCTEQTWYKDADGDGFGDPSISTRSCDKPDGYVADNTDFNDSNVTAYPGAQEICNDGVDNDGDSFTDCDDFDCTAAPECE